MKPVNSFTSVVSPQRTQSKLVRHEQCPRCREDGRDTKADNLGVYDDGHEYCYACSYYKHPIKGDMSDTFTYEYLPHRGLTKSTLEFYDIKTKVDTEGKPVSTGFKYPWGGYKVAPWDKKEFYWEPTGSSKAGLFGRDKFAAGSHRAVTITEGERDAPSIYQVVGSPCVSVRSSSSAVADVIADRSWVDSHDRIYLAFDNDAAGKAALKAVARLFDYNKLLVLDFDRRKDANEYLQNKEGDILRQLWFNAKRYLPETVVEVSKSNIIELLGEKPKQGVPYPFASLNDMTYGIRRGESVLITAQEGVGKTALMHAIEYQLLEKTNDAIGSIFLEEDKRDHLHALAGIELKKPVHLPDTGITQAEIAAAIEKAVKVDARLHLYNHFGSDDPDVLLDTIRFMVTARNVVYILLDHIGLCVSGLRDEKDERRALDYISTRLAMMIKELNFALILVSHVNDNGQTRGSRLIAKDCHVRIDATRDHTNADPKVRNTINLMVSKNRPIGRTGEAGSWLFDEFTRQYTAANDNGRLEDAPPTAYTRRAG